MSERAGAHGGSSERLDVAALLRAGADDELTSHDERRLEAHLETQPGDVARVEAERELRRAVRRALNEDASSGAPAGLRERVASAMANADLDTSVPDTMAPETRQTSFWASPRSRGILAMAALVAITLTLGIMFFQPQGTSPFMTSGLGTSQVIAERTSAATYVAKEHSRCFLETIDTGPKFTVDEPENLPSLAGNVVGQSIELADLIRSGATDIEFLNAGRCGVPGGGSSLHLRFTLPDRDDVVSLFIQEDSGRMNFEEGVTYEIPPTQEAPNSPSIFIWSREGLNYYLVIERPEECKPVRDLLSAPSTIRPLTDLA